MARYHVHFVDHSDRVFHVFPLDQEADGGAIEEAHRVDVPSIGGGFDVWQEGRLIHRHRR